MRRPHPYLVLAVAVGLSAAACSSGESSDVAETTGTTGTTLPSGPVATSDSGSGSSSATTSTPAAGAAACNEQDPRFEAGTWSGEGSFSSEVTSAGVAQTKTLTPGAFTFTVTVDGDGAVTAGSWSVTDMAVSVHAGDLDSTATYLGKGTLAGTGKELLMNGTFEVNSSVGGAFSVPIDAYPIVATDCKGGVLSGELSPTATAAAEAAGISGGFFAPWTAHSSS